jgi:hypothetical protein
VVPSTGTSPVGGVTLAVVPVGAAVVPVSGGSSPPAVFAIPPVIVPLTYADTAHVFSRRIFCQEAGIAERSPA